MDDSQLSRMEAYLLHQMPADEKASFEKEMQANPELAQAFNDHRKLVFGVQEVHFRNALQDIHLQMLKESNSESRGFRQPLIWAIAASLLIILGMIWFWPTQTPEPSFAEFSIELDAGLPTVLGENQSLAFGEGMIAYKLKNYEKAHGYWEPLLADDPLNDSLLFYLAQIDISKEKFPSAIEKLESVHSQTNSVFQVKSLWYLSLCHLKLGQSTEAKAFLETLTSIQNPYSRQAEDLLKHLNHP